MISMEEMRMLLTKVGGKMSEGQVSAVMAIADRDKNSLIDFAEFQSLWSLVMGEIEVFWKEREMLPIVWFNNIQEESEIREEFKRFDLDKNGYITKGNNKYRCFSIWFLYSLSLFRGNVESDWV